MWHTHIILCSVLYTSLGYVKLIIYLWSGVFSYLYIMVFRDREVSERISKYGYEIYAAI